MAPYQRAHPQTSTCQAHGSILLQWDRDAQTQGQKLYTAAGQGSRQEAGGGRSGGSTLSVLVPFQVCPPDHPALDHSPPVARKRLGAHPVGVIIWEAQLQQGPAGIQQMGQREHGCKMLHLTPSDFDPPAAKQTFLHIEKKSGPHTQGPGNLPPAAVLQHYQPKTPHTVHSSLSPDHTRRHIENAAILHY